MKVLLTGATGFIGSHVARELLDRGHEVHAVLRPGAEVRRIAGILPALHLHEGPMDHVPPVKLDAAVHMAWYAVPGKYLEAPENIECLEASRRLLAKLPERTVFAGTCFELDTRIGRLAEDAPTLPTNLYASCKDKLRQDVVARRGSAWVRFFYQYGPFEDPRRTVPSMISSLLKGEPVKMSPGEQRRDYLHVEDVASAVCSVLESQLEGVVHVGSGDATAMKDLGGMIAAVVGRSDLIKLNAVDYWPGEPMLIEADNAKLLSTGWRPRRPLQLGLPHTVQWWRREILPPEYDYVTGDGHTASWKRAASRGLYDVFAHSHTGGERRQVGHDVDEKTLKAIVNEYTGVRLSRNRVAW